MTRCAISRTTQVAAISVVLIACFGGRDRPFKQLIGTWDWADKPGSCTDNPFVISFSDDRHFMTLTYRHAIDSHSFNTSVVRYEVRSHSPFMLRTAIVDPPETRRSESGELVAWDLVLTGRDEFRWHEVHWKPTAATKRLVRCSAAAR